MPSNVKKILLGHNYYQQPGGEDGVFRSEIALLKSYGHELAVYERHNDEIKPGILSKLSHAASLRFSKTSYDQTRALIRSFKPDVAHFHNTFFVMTPSVFYACKDEGVPVAVSLHNFRLMCINGLFLRDGKPCENCLTGGRFSGVIHKCYHDSLVSSILASDMINHHWARRTWTDVVDQLIVATEFTRGKYVQAGIPPAKIKVLPPFVDNIPQTSHNAISYALYAGRLSEEKGVDILLDAWRQIKDFPLFIAGQGPLTERLEERIKSEGLDNVKVLGYLNSDDYRKTIAQARFMVVPSLCYESFPTVIVEAYSCGVPVVANNLGTMKEIVEDGRTGFLYAANDPKDLAAKARLIIGDDDKRGLLSANTKAIYDQKYTRVRHYDGLMSVFQGMNTYV